MYTESDRVELKIEFSKDVSYELLPSARQALTFTELGEVFRANGLTLEKNDYAILNLVGRNGQYTNLGFLLSDQCVHEIKIAVFSSEDEFEFLDRRDYAGPVFKVLEQAMEYLNLNNRLHSKVVKYQRVEKRDYSEVLLREGLLNAIIHQNYALNGAIQVSVYSDRIEILSLGGLVYGLEVGDLDSGISKSRNRFLSHVFYRMKYVEAYGTGLRKIRKVYENIDFDNIVKVTDHTFKLVLRNVNYKDERNLYIVKEKGATYSVYSLDEERVLELFGDREFITRNEVQDVLGVGQTKAGLVLKGLCEKRVIRRVGGGKGTRYCLV